MRATPRPDLWQAATAWPLVAKINVPSPWPTRARMPKYNTAVARVGVLSRNFAASPATKTTANATATKDTRVETKIREELAPI
jgi:hypothetical protein